MKKQIKPGARLQALADQVREGVALYDVGTDHAYLPVFLVGQGRVPRATASDIAPGPLARAERTIREAGLSDRVAAVLTDGLTDLTLDCPCDVVIAGMGGELIAKILSASPQVRSEDVRLILQPMTKAELLRDYLSENGFVIERELIAEEGKPYEILCCRGGGEPYALSEEERYVGRRGVRREDAAFFRLLRRRLASLTRAATGKRAGGERFPREQRAADELKEYLSAAREKEKA